METRPGNGHEIRDHEHTDIPVRTIGKYMLGLAISGVVIVIVLGFMWNWFAHAIPEEARVPAWQGPRELPPSPRLQLAPRIDPPAKYICPSIELSMRCCAQGCQHGNGPPQKLAPKKISQFRRDQNHDVRAKLRCHCSVVFAFSGNSPNLQRCATPTSQRPRAAEFEYSDPVEYKVRG